MYSSSLANCCDPLLPELATFGMVDLKKWKNVMNSNPAYNRAIKTSKHMTTNNYRSRTCFFM